MSPPPVVERDYILAHIVAQLHRAKLEDGVQLLIKGGTALRFFYIGDYRYSADLDFTLIGESTGTAIAAIPRVLDAARQHAGFPYLQLSDSDPPAIAYIGPLGAGKARHIKLDMTADEYVEEVAHLTIRDVWDDLPHPVPVDAYSIEEIGAEKLRCIIQRVQCRDLYDLCRLIEDLQLSIAEIRRLFERKAMTKGLDPAAFRERFEDRVERYRSLWDDEMGDHLAQPPQFDDMLRVVRRHLRSAGMLRQE